MFIMNLVPQNIFTGFKNTKCVTCSWKVHLLSLWDTLFQHKHQHPCHITSVSYTVHVQSVCHRA